MSRPGPQQPPARGEGGPATPALPAAAEPVLLGRERAASAIQPPAAAPRARTAPPGRGGGTRARRPRLSRRWIVACSALVGTCLLIVVGLLVVYPRLGAWMIRQKVGDKVAARLGREVRFGAIEVSLGHAVLRDVELRGPHDGDTPLVRVARVEVDFDAWRSLIGTVRVFAARVDGVDVTVRRGPDGVDNISDLIDRLRSRGPAGSSGGAGLGAGYTPDTVTVARIHVLADDAVTSATALIGEAEARWARGGELVAELRGLSATSIAAPKAGVAKIGIRKPAGGAPVVTVEGGEVALYPRLALSGIAGTIAPSATRPREYAIDLTGGYGGVPGTLWTAKGGLDPEALTAAIDLEAAKFQLERLAPILARSAVVDYADTSVDTRVRLELSRAGARFGGEFHLRGLNVGHPMIADKEVHDLDLSGQIGGSFDLEARRLELTRGDFQTRDVTFSVTGSAAAPRRTAAEAEAIARARAAKGSKAGPAAGPGGVQELKLWFVIPPTDCQRVLAAIPKEMVPAMNGFQLRGVFDSDIRLEIDWRDLDATVLDGNVGIRRCKVIKEPADSAKRLEEEFEHYVEYEADKWMSFVVGESNEDFVKLEDISPHLINSIMSTEDSLFYQHKGFITSEFRSALVNDLKAGKFTHGASSITMQMVKNVLLFREKTLARKLQELFLTWHVENTLEKDRILEIYLNVIEYGPALYGIGPAARHYFGKRAKDLNPVESAFFSSILPSPKERYKQYCANTLTKLTEDKIKLYLGVMLKRKRLTQEEYDRALDTPLRFVQESDETEEECLKRTQKAIKNARPTNPMKQAGAPRPKRPKPKKPKPTPPREQDDRPPA